MKPLIEYAEVTTRTVEVDDGTIYQATGDGVYWVTFVSQADFDAFMKTRAAYKKAKL